MAAELRLRRPVRALRRLFREGRVQEPDVWRCVRRLDELRDIWTEVTDVLSVRRRAERCLNLHPLRAADAGQLAAALVFSEVTGRSIPFVTLDVHLATAASREGFEVQGLSPASGS